MNQDKYITLVYKKLKKEISNAEQQELKAWLQVTENQTLYNDIEADWKLTKTLPPSLNIDTKGDFQQFKNRMQQHKASKATSEAIIKPMRSRRLFAIAAAIAALLVAGWWMFSPNPANTASPLLTATTKAGETKVLQLADGSTVTLNELTSFSYPQQFDATSRKVQLQGEAYFEIDADKNRPFSIQTPTNTVTVLGTAFNVRNYASETYTEVEVEEGKVAFKANNSEETLILTKGEQGNYNHENQQLTKKTLSATNANAWKDRNLTYKSATLKTVMQDLNRHFKLIITFTDPKMQDCLISARFSDAEAFDILEYIVNLYEMELVKITATNYQLEGGICE
jgi:ferric-dicitrate binding protein FerR (iron transport regulator)